VIEDSAKRALDGEPIVVEGELNLTYRWSAGIAGTAFLTALRDEGKILGARCEQCDRVLCPPRTFCEQCFSATVWTEVASTGTIETFTVNHIATDASRLKEPWVLAIVRLDNSDGGLVHRVEADPDEVHIGMRVEAVLADERRGHLTDILHFRPVA
jgi:uncharacterized OB-fold protein